MPAKPANNEATHLKASEAAVILSVHPRTVGNWARQGLLRSITTPGGHRRFPREAVMAIYEGRTQDALPFPIGIPAQRKPSED